MVVSSSSKVKKGLKMLVKSLDCTPSKFQLYPKIGEEKYPQGSHSSIPPRVLLIHDIRSFYHYFIQELGNLKLDQACAVLCENDVLKLEHKNLKVKGFTHIIQMPKNFWINWIKLILRQFHDMSFWLEKTYPVTKKMIHRIIGYPMIEKSKTTKTLGQVELKTLTLVEWDGRGMKLNNVTHMEIKFCIHVITHKIYSSSCANNMPCKEMDLAYKIVKKNLSFNLVKLQFSQLRKNIESI